MKSEEKNGLQDMYLQGLVKNKIYAAIYLISGRMLEGRITDYDHFTLILERENHSQLIYKHGISAIARYNPNIHTKDKNAKVF
jgi:host factor-I protein